METGASATEIDDQRERSLRGGIERGSVDPSGQGHADSQRFTMILANRNRFWPRGGQGYCGEIFRERMQNIIEKNPVIKLVRGKGLLNAIVVDDHEEGHLAWNICLKLAQKGLLAKPTHGNIIRFAPPLVMTEDQLHECCDIIEDVIANF